MTCISKDSVTCSSPEKRKDFQQESSNRFPRKMSVHMVSMRGYTKKLMEGKEKTTRSQMSGGPDGPEVRIMKAGGARMVTVTVTLTMHEAKWPRALTTLRWCLLISQQCLKSVKGGAAKL